MLMEKAPVDIKQCKKNPDLAPVTAGPLYIENTAEIHVPVFFLPDLPDPVYAPPFLIPQGVWTVIFQMQTPDAYFDDVCYKDQPVGVKIIPGPRGEIAWSTTFDTSHVNHSNKMHCDISVKSNRDNGTRTYIGDPTIAVVQDPMGCRPHRP
jgi:hypothetical protein